MKIPKLLSRIPDKYSQEAIFEANNIRIDLNQYKNRETVVGITIDKRISKDLDDGFFAKYDANKSQHIIEASISDITEIIKLGSYLDIEAFSRCTSLYYEEKPPIHMYPEIISTNIASLNHKKNRLAVTVRMHFDNDFNLLSIEPFESIFYNKKRYDYESFEEDYNDEYCENYANLRYFHEIAIALSKKRKTTNFSDDDRKIGIKYHNEELEIPSFIVQEFMIITNKAVAIYMASYNVTISNRIHMPEYKNKVFSGEMQRAYYSSETSYHYGLGLDFYCHFTSPIRRYADIIVHRQLKALLNAKELPYTKNEISKQCIYINEQILNLKKMQAIELEEIEKSNDSVLLNNLINNSYRSDLSTISQDIFNTYLETVLTNGTKINKRYRTEIIRRISEDKIKESLLFQAFLSSHYLISYNARESIKRQKKFKSFFKFLETLGLGINFTYTRLKTKNAYSHSLRLASFGNITVLHYSSNRSTNKNIMTTLSADMFIEFCVRRKKIVKSLMGV